MSFLDKVTTSKTTPKASISTGGGFLDKVSSSPQTPQPEPTQPVIIPQNQSFGMAKTTQAVPTSSTPNITPASVTKQIVQPIARTVGSVGITAGNLPFEIAGKKGPFQETIQTDQSKITRLAFGGEPIKTVQQRMEETKKSLEPYVGNTTAGLFQGVPVVASIALDLSGWGGRKAVKDFVPNEIPESFFKYLAKEKSAVKIEKTLTDIGFSQYAKPLSEQWAKVTTPQQAKDVISAFDEVMKAPKLAAEANIASDIRDLPLSIEQKSAMQALREGAATPDILKVVKTIDPKVFEAPKGGFLDQIQKPSVENTPITPGNVPETKIPVSLEQEAKKYKSAEEFVKAQGTPIYHGTTNESATAIEKGGFKIMDKQRGGRYTGDGVYFTPESSGASNFSGEKGKVLEAYLKTKNFKTVYLPENNIDWQPGSDLVNEWKQKYDGVIIKSRDTDTKTGKVVDEWVNEIVSFKPEQIKTKSQLIDIWNKANTPSQPKAPVYTGEKDLTTKILKDLEGKSTVSRQYILDATNRGELKQSERDIVRQVLDEMTTKQATSVQRGKGNLIEITDKNTGKKETRIVISEKPDGSLVTTSKDVYFPTKVSLEKFDVKNLEEQADIPSGGYTFGEMDKIDNMKVNVQEFADKVKSELLPLKVKSSDVMKPNPKHPYPIHQEEGAYYPKYESIALPEDLRGPVKNYRENIYESPIETSVGKTHFDYTTKNYFGHTRVEDMADNTTRRVIEVQSDLYQKGNLEKEMRPTKDQAPMLEGTGTEKANEARNKLNLAYDARNKELSKLQQYNDPSAHFRMVREEIKKAAQDGKTKLQFPTGETAMKIEGLGDTTLWAYADDTNRRVMPDEMKVGMSIVENRPNGIGDNWIITNVLGDGKFKAIPKPIREGSLSEKNGISIWTEKNGYQTEITPSHKEEFDISGKVDTNNPIYRFYEKDLGKYLNKFGAQKVTDSKGVTWYEIPISKSQSGAVEAFSKRRPLLNKDIYMSKDEIREILFKDIPKNDLTLIFTKELIQGVADGSFVVHPTLGNLIRLFEEGGKVSLLTALHEQKHYFFSKLSPEIQKEALAIAKKEMGPLYKNKLESLYKDEYNDSPNKIDMLLEEYVVDKWSKSDASKGFGYKQSVYGKIFAALDNLLKRMVTTYNKVKARADAFFKERGGSKGGYINFGEEKPKKTPFGKSVGKVTIGGKEIDITKGGQMDIPVPAKVSEIEKDLIEKKIQLELKQELLENSPFKSKENRLMVDREGLIRELGDIKSKKLIRKVEDRMAESGVSDPAEFSAGVEKYFQDKQDIAKLKRDIVALESTGNFAEGQRKQVKDIVKDSKLLLQESGAPIKTSAEGLPIALSKRQKEIVANSPFKDVSPVRIPVVEGTYAEIKAIEKLASQAESYIHGTPLPQGMTFAEVLEKTVTPIENKIGWFDILVRTPDRVMEGIGLGQEAKDLRTAMDGYWKELPKNLEKISDWLNELGTKEASTRVFKYLDGQAVDLNPLEQKVANEIRSWLATWPDRLGLKQDQRITDYITRIFDNDKPQEFDEELAKIIQDKIPGSVYNPFTLKRLGARGYKEDLGLALDAYVKRSTRKAYMDPVLERIQSKTGSEAALSKLEESQFTYVQDYINNINMRPTKGDKRADNTIKKFFKFFGGEKGLKMVGQRPIATVSRGLRRTASRSMLGLNLGTALRNLSQGVNTYAVLGEKYTTIGYVNLFKQGAFDELKEEGVLNAGFIQDKILSSTAKFWEKTDKVLYSLIEVGELINRGSAYFGAKAKYISENRKIMDGVEVWKEGSSMRDAIDYAKGIVRKTQFSFDSVDTPVGLQGDFVKTVIQFLGYPIKQAEFLFELAKDKNYAGILRYILGGVLFTYTIGQLFDMKLKNLVPTVDLGWPPSIKIFTSLFDTITNAPDKFGNKNPLGKRLQNLGSTAFKTVVPGGTQINKTYQGLKAVKAGGSVDSAGRTQFKVGGTTLSNIRAAAFGKYAGKNAQDYFDKITPSERAYKNLLKYDDKKDFLTKLAKNDPDVAKGVIDILKKKAQGITEEDEKIKNMGVKNGQRAEAINKKLKKLKNNKERKDLLTDYIEKGILTEDVMVQLAELK